ncbi:MBL fold metallo-hydrolase [Paracoccus haeundaensis]|uniref:MBL fold metallo-hydrolase n=1 Tax=Paracoccus haeundaensis TaxID=225362 RepID=A0A5C4R0Y7_9RHOB|nr:MBL fold metallo-hydrolase [Paracoccus haeundaensis]TNH37576.1 MBL fold metallo-hydrolase [Paracoccus haeundaensis]
MTHPDQDKIQVIVFGPGFGECILIHIGDHGWIIIDSCLNDDKEPAGLSYLSSIGVDVENNIKLIVATHWHDDHIKGLFKTLEVAKSANFAMSSAMSHQEFLAFLIAHDRQPNMRIGRGGTEIIKCLRLMKSRGKVPKFVVQDRLIESWDIGKISHGKRVELLALSPSDAQLADTLADASKFLRDNSTENSAKNLPKKRISSENKNNLSIAALLVVGDIGILFGADVEERNIENYGWKNIVTNRKDRAPSPFIFKVAHHGSQGAHLDQVWDDFLEAKPISIVTPWKLGGNFLPKAEDIQRIKERSSFAYITSSEIIPLKRRYDREVLKDIQRSGVSLTSIQYKCGSVSITVNPDSGVVEETVLTNTAKLI